jgi:hypothetical protein
MFVKRSLGILSWTMFLVFPAAAQYYKAARCPRDKRGTNLTFGLDLAAGIKTEPAAAGTLSNRNIFAIGAYGWMHLPLGREEKAGLTLRAGVLSDPTRFAVMENAWFQISRVQLRLELLGELRIAQSGWRILAGGGAEYTCDPGLSFATFGNYNGSVYSGVVDKDSSFSGINRALNRVIPFASAGGRYVFSSAGRSSRWSMYVLATQNLSPMFRSPFPVYYSINGQAKMASINYTPLFFNLGATVRL